MIDVVDFAVDPADPADIADKADDRAPYFSLVLVPGWEARP